MKSRPSWWAPPRAAPARPSSPWRLIAGLRSRGLTVQPFKVGPDYLDPSLLSWVAGRPCRNLDSWMVPEPHLLELFHRACRGADVAVVEGVMGLFDGRSGAGDQASTADVARLLRAPVLLLVDAARASRTVGAVALGLSRADPRLQVAGAILNRVASDRHLETCVEGLSAAGVACAGHLRRADELALPERYLGLISAGEKEPRPGLRAALEAGASTLDLDLVMRAAAMAAPPDAETGLFPESPIGPGHESASPSIEPSTSTTATRSTCWRPGVRSWSPSRRWRTGRCPTRAASTSAAATRSSSPTSWPGTPRCWLRCVERAPGGRSSTRSVAARCTPPSASKTPRGAGTAWPACGRSGSR